MTIGSKLQVWNGTATKTSGGLTRSDLMQSPRTGKIISKKQYANGVRQAKNIGVTPKRVSKGVKGEGIFSGLLDSIGLGLPPKKGKGKGRPRKTKGGILDKTTADLAPLMAGFNALKRMPKNLASDVGDMFESLSPMHMLLGKGMKKKRTTKKGKGVYTSAGGKVRKTTKKGAKKGKGVYTSAGGKVRKGKGPRKTKKGQKGEGAWDSFMTGFSAPFKAAAAVAPFAMKFL